MKPITVLLAEDHQMVREGFRTLLKLERDIEVVGEADTGRQAVELARKLQPAVVVMDIAMPQLNGLEATRQIRKALPDTKVLILTAHNDDAYVEQMIGLGASGFLVKQNSAHVLVTAIRTVNRGSTFYSTAISERLRLKDQAAKNRGGQPRLKTNQLSSREVEVLQLIAEGQSNKQVAADLGISSKTVEKHRQHIMAKLDIHDTASLTRYAISSGIIESHVQLTIV